MGKIYNLRQINEFRKKLYDILTADGDFEEEARAICAFDDMIIAGNYGSPDRKATKKEAMQVWSEIMEFNTPESYAEIMSM